MQTDETDLRLIEHLRHNARAPVAELARILHLSRTTVQSRLERLERAGVITGYTVRLSDAHEADRIHAYILLTAAPKQAASVIAAARKMPGVRRLASVSGPFDFVCVASASGVSEMDDLIDSLGALDGVERTTSSIVLSVKIDR
jgi:DNA-binding Lrp family transcriptional regulator